MAQLLVVAGAVIQEVVADAMSPEVVPRTEARRQPRGRRPTSTPTSPWWRCWRGSTYSFGAFAVGLAGRGAGQVARLMTGLS